MKELSAKLRVEADAAKTNLAVVVRAKRLDWNLRGYSYFQPQM